MKYQFVLLYLFMFTLIALPQQFIEQITTTLPGVWLGSTAWGDYDNDGDLDLFVTGLTSDYKIISKLYRNEGNGNFLEQSEIFFTGVYLSSVAWGDFDNDCYLDLLITGNTSLTENNPVSKIYKNNGDNTFSEQTLITLPGVCQGSVAWCDYNNDDNLDLILTGQSTNAIISKIYFNDGNGSFTEETSILITGVKNSSVAWGDYNNDGNYDLLVAGYTGSSNISKIYRNNGNNSFTEQTTIFLTGVSHGSASWGDLNNDGKLDILLTGLTDNNFCTKVYLNNENNTFIESVGNNLPSICYGGGALVDYNKDSFIDIFLTGITNSSQLPRSKIYRNNGNSNFSDQQINYLPGVCFGSSCWGDYDNDGDVDFVISGLSETNSIITKIFKNNADVNFKEQTTISLANVSQSSAAWGDYDNDGNLDIILTGEISTNVGFSRIYKNNGDNTFTEQSQIELANVFYGSVAWGDYDNDGNLDLLLTGATSQTNQISKIYKNNGDNTFTEQTSIALTGVTNSSVAWGDYNNDGYLDILLTGNNGTEYISVVYKNNGSNNFEEQVTIMLSGVAYSSTSWCDYDNDGWLDILISGQEHDARITKIYRNNGDNTFSEQTSFNLVGVSYSASAWGDYDNDGFFDLVITGYNGNNRISKIYRNNNGISFIEQTSIELTGVYNGAVAWGDYDNDGLLDLLLTGNANDGIMTKIYRNNGNNSFTEIPSQTLIEVWVSSVSWGDYDNDGDLDILLSGYTGSQRITKVYRNDSFIQNHLPNPPTNLSISITGKEVTFVWDKATDFETTQSGLTYNLVIGTQPNGIDKLSPMSNRQNGYRKIINLGNTNKNNFKVIKDLPNGTYFWSVQSIDNSFAGSIFAEEQSFNLGGVKLIIEGLYDVTNNRLNLNDTVRAYLREISYPYDVVDSAITVLDSITFTANFEFVNAPSGIYYLAINHRNSIETWSKSGGIPFVQGAPLTYDFTNDSASAFGFNLVKKGSKWCIYNGDINQDGKIDNEDLLILYDEMYNNCYGHYSTSDLDGDGIIDAQDSAICFNNKIKNIIKRTPISQ